MELLLTMMMILTIPEVKIDKLLTKIGPCLFGGVKVFFDIFTVDFDGLFQVRVNDCTAGLDNWPYKVRAPSRGYI